jgi:hypothetical protein
MAGNRSGHSSNFHYEVRAASMNLSRPNKHKFFSINHSTIREHTTTLIGSCNETKAFLFCDFHYFAFINGLMGVM